MVRELRFEDKDYSGLKDMFMEEKTEDEKLHRRIIEESFRLNGIRFSCEIGILREER